MPIHPSLLSSIAILTTLAGLAPAFGQDSVINEPVPLAEQVRAWLDRFERKGEFWGGAEQELRASVTALTSEILRHPDRLAEDGAVLVDVAWEEASFPRRRSFVGGSDRERVRAVGFDAIEALRGRGLERELLRWMTGEVLAQPNVHATSRRFLALAFVDRHRTEEGKLALLTIGRRQDDPLRPAALSILATWPDESVDLFLVGLIARKHDTTKKPHPFNILLSRVRDQEAPLGPRATEALVERLAVKLISTDWREASRAIELARGLELERQVPLLIAALKSWNRRVELGGGSKRILYEVVRELRRISGRSIGTNPRNWTTWWIAVRQGKTQIASELEEPEGERSHATFFGLRPVSDRVTFVIDLSGSMTTEWGTTGHNRFVEAVEQMMRFLQASGARTHFNVIVFNDVPVRSSSELVPATTETLESARSALLELVPDGNTHLRPAIQLALELDARGEVDPNELEADTIVVLCDGETAEGRSWVRPVLERVHADARVVFHCVLIGTRGDGTLEALAERTGGDFLRIGG